MDPKCACNSSNPIWPAIKLPSSLQVLPQPSIYTLCIHAQLSTLANSQCMLAQPPIHACPELQRKQSKQPNPQHVHYCYSISLCTKANMVLHLLSTTALGACATTTLGPAHTNIQLNTSKQVNAGMAYAPPHSSTIQLMQENNNNNKPFTDTHCTNSYVAASPTFPCKPHSCCTASYHDELQQLCAVHGYPDCPRIAWYVHSCIQQTPARCALFCW